MTTDISAAEVRGDFVEILTYLAGQGFAEQVGSWVSDSVTNIPISGEQLISAFPEGALDGPAAEAGLFGRGVRRAVRR
ncbi:hypothetical protein [Streptomyces sp. NPDC051546]|uniref:hypothetical protein n=1 Tax=Streptomyces sp. NPDC051546 TaxID=3365655 RepID=UPI0037BB2B1D